MNEIAPLTQSDSGTDKPARGASAAPGSTCLGGYGGGYGGGCLGGCLGGQLGRRLEGGLIAAAVAAAATWLWLSLCIFPLRSWNDIRLAPTFALKLGLPLYPGADGAASTWMYGPLPVWLHWPSTWATGPGEALLIAGAINMLLAVSAIVVVCLAWPTPQAGPLPLGGRLLAAAITIAIWPWANWQFLQADNYAVAFGLLSNLALMRSNKPPVGWLAAGLATAGMMCKQTSLGVPLGQVAWLAATSGPRPAVQHIGRLFIAGCGWVAILLLTNDPARVWFTAIITPASLPWAESVADRFVHLLPYMALHLVLPVAAWLWLAQRQATGDLLLPSLAWLVAWLPGLASAFKTGGTLNCLQGFLLWLPPAAVVMVAALSMLPWGNVIRVGLACVTIVILGGRIATRPVRLWEPLTAVAAYGEAFELAQRLPERAWFPWNPLITIFSESRLYHVEDGLYVRSLIGRPVVSRASRLHLPPRFSAIVVSNQGSTWGIAEKLLPGPLEKIDLGSWMAWRSQAAATPQPEGPPE